MTHPVKICACSIGLLLAVGGCAMNPSPGASQEQQVVAAQLAAKPAKAGPAMRGDEANVIYGRYIDAIGKPLGPRESQTTETQ